MELLKQRQHKKKEAENKYNMLKTTIENAVNDTHKRDIEYEMSSLKKQFTRLNDKDIQAVKDLMKSYGVEYFEAPREADELCAYFTQTGKAYACFTDDMDMFIYDCPFVIRNVSLMNHTAFIYDKISILNELKINQKLFREIMILSGTDYNIDTNTSLKETIKWFNKYNNYLLETEKQPDNPKKPLEFYVWLVKTTKYITDYSILLKIYKMFMITDNFNEIENKLSLLNMSNNIHLSNLQQIMVKEGFVFLQ
jgi:5'-3' exonuclease